MSAVPGVDDALLRVGSLVVLILALAVSSVVLRRFGDENRLGTNVRERFVCGVPWGTVVVVGFVYGVYYLLQGGGQSGGPIVTGFRSWSLWYPQGTLLSSFAHASESHLLGNIISALAFAPLAEYAWGHYPDERSHSTNSRLETPPARIAAFVTAVFVVGVFGSLIVPGAVIGFSGVVFAFAGFALVTVPAGVVIGILAIQVISLLHRSLTDPFVVAQSQELFVRPAWADVAVQGHLYGLLVGVLLATLVLQYRERTPDVSHVFFAALVFAITRSLQSIYWYLGGETYVLFRALGTAGVFLLATLVAIVARKSEAMLVSRIDLRVGTAATGTLLALVLALALIGVPYNVVAIDSGENRQGELHVEDYTITYDEGVEDRYIASLDVPFTRGPTINRSGVIVASERRNAWEIALSAQQLEAETSATIAVGDATWRETVEIRRTTWTVAGMNSTYKVFGNYDGNWQRLYAAEPAQAEPVIAGKTVTIRPAATNYEIVVGENETQVGVATIPEDGGRVTVANITFERDGNTLSANHEQTRLQIAQYEA